MKFHWVFFLLFSNFLLAQNEIPQDYFQNPLKINPLLSGTFGELRNNHFHGGWDIKTEQQEGLEVVSSAEGFVSRIKISTYGYGKALYIQHPNGYTTVYGHLSKLSPEIEAFVEKKQYENESFEIELFPEADELPVSQGQLIAFSGNTGGSGGPHLHFEIRDGQQRPMNPMLFGIEIKDTRPPTIRSLYVYPLSEDAHVNNSNNRQRINLTGLKDGSFKANTITACGDIGFGISTTDKLDGSHNNNGVFKITSVLNGQKMSELLFDRFSFAETRFLNHLIDYEFYSNHNSRVQKLFNTNNPVSIYKDVTNEGKLHIQDEMSYEYQIHVSDFAGNERIIRIPIEGKQAENLISQKDTTGILVNSDASFVFEKNGIDLYIPENALYEDVYLDLEFENGIAKVHKDDVAIHKHISLGFDVSNYKMEDRGKLFIGRIGYKGRPIYSETNMNGDRLVTGIRTFGEYKIFSDTTPPSVKSVNFRDGQWISNLSTLQIRISDYETGIKSYKATVNGKFILMEYDYKTNLLTHYFEDGVVTDTENKLKLIVTDNVGNSTIFEATFFRKQ
ncbi:MAG TPA: M23 family metallopeptidase [Salinimicrobium sp.]|nr:M23 family metallopeptidase [Salinimicrobium sp.]